jgi:hypothetical protein
MSSRFEQEMERKVGRLVERGSMGRVVRQEQPQGDSFGFWQCAFVFLVLGVAFGWWGPSDKLISPNYSAVQQYHRCAMARDDATYIMHCMSAAGYTFEMEKCIGYGHTIISEDDGINKCFVVKHWWSGLTDSLAAGWNGWIDGSWAREYDRKRGRPWGGPQ